MSLQSLTADLKLSLKPVNFLFLAKYKHGRHHSQTPGESARVLRSTPPRLAELELGHLGTERSRHRSLQTGLHFSDNLIVGMFFFNFYLLPIIVVILAVSNRKVCH